jgi:cobalt-zinc-cadmium efflux system outer membrane protein
MAPASVASEPSEEEARPPKRPIALEVPTFVAPAELPKELPPEEPFPEPEGAIGLEDALATALMHNPELAMFSWDTRAAEARALQAGQKVNPELDMRRYLIHEERDGRSRDQERTRVVLNQTFEMGGKRRHRLYHAEVERDLAGWDYEAKRIEVATGVWWRFAEVLGAQHRVAVHREAVAFFEETRGSVAALVDSGARASLERHQAQRLTGLANIELSRAESELGAARFGLAAMWGGQVPKFTEAIGELSLPRTLPDLETVIAYAQDSPEIARWHTEYELGQAALGLAKARRVPDLRYGVGIRWEDDIDDRDYLFDIEVDLPVFDRKQGEIREARNQMARARDGRRAAEAANATIVSELYFGLAEAEARVNTLRDDVVPTAAAILEAQKVGFANGAADVENLLDARRDLARAESDAIEALVQYHQILASLEAAVGRTLRVE